MLSTTLKKIADILEHSFEYESSIRNIYYTNELDAITRFVYEDDPLYEVWMSDARFKDRHLICRVSVDENGKKHKEIAVDYPVLDAIATHVLNNGDIVVKESIPVALGEYLRWNLKSGDLEGIIQQPCKDLFYVPANGKLYGGQEKPEKRRTITIEVTEDAPS